MAVPSSGGTEPEGPVASGQERAGVLGRTGAQVAEVVQRLSREHCLPAKPARGSAWYELREAVRAAYVARAGACGSRRGRAIIMAGAPGAGKSRAVGVAGGVLGAGESGRMGLDEAGFTTVDADDVKQLLLGNRVEGLEVDQGLLEGARAHWDALLARHAPQVLADGRPVVRGELATLVHQMSTDTADLVRKDLLKEGFDVKIEGTLQWMESPARGQGPRLLDELKAAKYGQVVVVVADTPRQVCERGAFQRWAGPRSRGEVGARFTPRSAVAGVFQATGDGEVCRCTDNARATFNQARQVESFAQVDLVVVTRREDQPTLVEHVDRCGQSHRHEVPQQAPQQAPRQTPQQDPQQGPHRSASQQASRPGQPKKLSPQQVLASIQHTAATRHQGARPPQHGMPGPRNTLGR
ncbi:hypothetical protein [Actinomyces weissii]|uniref:Uncharacterized protein n=1 Tax=Actinomyces weissii TaxID=675090 RepID=A0A7T7MBC9_9ACTO|nr:hypothetical protein [Actinomyces weissii]QQM67817.1 hypothetical protein JG540_02740 [Actinomyces weissii]